ncbi:MAG: DUF5672 family protein [Candidatus Babeliales bacterium]|nr:DUF5672 family protein [Candidatus Babeliales bacterium]
MKIALLLVTYERPGYLKECLESLNRADLSKVDYVYIIDDNSKDNKTIELIENFKFNNKRPGLTENLENIGIVKNLYEGYNYLFQQGYDIVINLDSDALVRNDFIDRLIENYIFNTLLTGFHSTTMNRHVILGETENFYLKKSVGGINFCIDKAAYENFVKPALEQCIKQPTNWDHVSSLNAGGVYCLKESVIQHIGFESSLGHHDNPDIAESFKDLHLPTVTLIGVDSNLERLQKAAEICNEHIKFADIKLLNEPLTSKEQYSQFCIKELYKHVKTEHLLICQYDGFINNWKTWDNDFLNYDYIGAPWYYTDGMDVGNGGFSLRSRRLMEILATDERIKEFHPEDHHICRTYRPYLEFRYGIKFAPLEVAERFAFEGYAQPTKFLSDQFGVHGLNARKKPEPKIANEKYVFNQPRGLGDILFLVPLCRALMREGNTVIWPIDPEYFEISKHFPDIDFRDQRTVSINYESKGNDRTQYGIQLPYRWAAEITGHGWKRCMQAKYEMYGHNYLMWRELTWKRNYIKEKELVKMVGASGEYVLVNRNFARPDLGLKINCDVKGIEMRIIPGFTLIDWCGIIEGASEIHTANTAINYLIELMDIKVPVYMYSRIPENDNQAVCGENGFEYTRELWQNPCWRFIE